MSWCTLLSYIQALPQDVKLSDDNKNVVIKVDQSQPIILPVEEAHNLIVNACQEIPSSEVVKYINAFLKENTSFLCDEDILCLSMRLSDEMEELKVTVKISNSLSSILQAAKLGKYEPDLTGTKHKITIQLQICEPDSTVYEATGSDVTRQIPFLKYNHHDQFSIAFTMTKLTETVFDGAVTDMQALLALVVVLKCQPASWRDFTWDAWLAVTIQFYLLESNKEVFPCQWMKQVFYAESFVEPKDVKCLLLGQDPVSKPNETIELTDLRNATGIAFHAIGNDNSSIEGMKEHYGINCFDDGPIDLCKDGRLMVNMIRCIGFKDYSVSNNSCRGAWIAYTLKLAHHLTKSGKPVIVFCKFPAALPAMYMPTACVDPNLTRVPHPAYVNPYYDKEDIDKVKEILSNI